MNEKLPEKESPWGGLSRRSLLLGAGAAGAAGVGGFALGAGGSRPDSTTPVGAPVPADGQHQAGVGRPSVPQQHCLIAIVDTTLAGLSDTLSSLGEHITAITHQPDGLPELTPGGPGDLTVTVGLGGETLARTPHPQLADLLALPNFAGDEDLVPARRGGGMLLSVNATDPVVLEPVLASLLKHLPDASIRWSQFGYRGAVADGIARNPFGYLDGIIRPTTTRDFRDDVWIAEGPLAGGTICVIRSFHLDTEKFRALPRSDRDAVFGRSHSTGAPLSGGSRDDEVDLDAKSAEGVLLVPAHAHSRAAHPAFTGSSLMLRRSYSFRNSASDHGHLFVSYQNDVATFSRTQLRMDDMDALSAFISPTATAAFAVLPGVQPGRPLGSSLF